MHEHQVEWAVAGHLVSETVRINLLGAGINFKDRGDFELKGVPGILRLFAIEG